MLLRLRAPRTIRTVKSLQTLGTPVGLATGATIEGTLAEVSVPTDFTIGLLDRPGSLAKASDALGRAGVNIDGACGYICEGQGRYHVLVADAERTRRALIDSGFVILDERQVVLCRIEDRPGTLAELLRRISDAGVNLDLLYHAVDGQVVLGGDDVPKLQRATA